MTRGSSDFCARMGLNHEPDYTTQTHFNPVGLGGGPEAAVLPRTHLVWATDLWTQRFSLDSSAHLVLL